MTNEFSCKKVKGDSIMRGLVSFNWVTAVLVIAACIGCSKAPSVKPAEKAEKVEELKKKLAAIRSQNVGKGTDWAKLEGECLELIKDFNSPANLGKIYATIVRIYSDTGFTSRDVQLPKTIEYAKKALEYPLDVPTKCHMYGKWAGALIAKALHGPEEDMIEIRREAIVPILRGFKLALDNKAPKEMQEPLGVDLFTLIGDINSPANQNLLRKHKEQLAARKKVDLLNTLSLERWAFTQKCITLYSQKPYDTAELIDLASKILPKHKDVVDELVAEVKASIAQKEESNLRRPPVE